MPHPQNPPPLHQSSYSILVPPFHGLLLSSAYIISTPLVSRILKAHVIDIRLFQVGPSLFLICPLPPQYYRPATSHLRSTFFDRKPSGSRHSCEKEYIFVSRNAGRGPPYGGSRRPSHCGHLP